MKIELIVYCLFHNRSLPSSLLSVWQPAYLSQAVWQSVTHYRDHKANHFIFWTHKVICFVYRQKESSSCVVLIVEPTKTTFVETFRKIMFYNTIPNFIWWNRNWSIWSIWLYGPSSQVQVCWVSWKHTGSCENCSRFQIEWYITLEHNLCASLWNRLNKTLNTQ